jgi:hypothetical protein
MKLVDPHWRVPKMRGLLDLTILVQALTKLGLVQPMILELQSSLDGQVPLRKPVDLLVPS